MLSTLHANSALGVLNDLALFDIPETQFSHESSFVQEILPVSSSFNQAESVEFQIRNVSDFWIDPSSLLLSVQGRVLRANNEEIISAAANNIQPDVVWPVDNMLSSLFESCEIYLNDIRVSGGGHYSYRSFMDLLTTANQSMSKCTLWPLGYSNDTSNQAFNRAGGEGIPFRFRIIQNSRVFQLVSPLFASLCQQGKLLLNGVNMRICLRQTNNNFRLMTSAEEQRNYKFDLSKIALRAKFVKIAPTVSLSIEKALAKGKKALYALRGVDLSYRSIAANMVDLILDDLAPRCVPARLTLLFVRTESFYGNKTMNPFKFENLGIEQSCLTVGNRKIEQNFDFEHHNYAAAYMDLIRQIGNPHLYLHKDVYENNHFFHHFVLTADGSTDHFSSISNENVRFTAHLRAPLEHRFTVIIITENPKLLEIDKDRNVRIIDPSVKT
jgi:hypothetical protein